MALNIQNIRSGLNLGGARPTLFEVHMVMPAGVDNGEAGRKLIISCEAAELPPSNMGVIGVQYMGRTIKYAGDRDFSPWSVRIINDEDFVVRNALETWHSLINTRVGNRRAFASDAPSLYKASAEVLQYDRQDNVLRRYVMQGLWPSNISAIGLDWGAQNQIEKFEVTFEYDWYDILGRTGTAGPSI